jgi:hypothetical protein
MIKAEWIKMGQLPKDPQQLAQDILAGRVSIQQLQAEQARRRAAQEALRQNMRTRPKPSGAPAHPSGARVVVKPSGNSPRPPRRQARPGGGSAPDAAGTRRLASETRGGVIRAVAPATAQPAASAPAKGSAASAKPAAAPRTAAQSLRAVLNNSNALRSVFVLSELLDKPLSLRPDPLERF